MEKVTAQLMHRNTPGYSLRFYPLDQKNNGNTDQEKYAESHENIYVSGQVGLFRQQAVQVHVGLLFGFKGIGAAGNALEETKEHQFPNAGG